MKPVMSVPYAVLQMDEKRLFTGAVKVSLTETLEHVKNFHDVVSVVYFERLDSIRGVRAEVRAPSSTLVGGQWAQTATAPVTVFTRPPCSANPSRAR